MTDPRPSLWTRWQHLAGLTFIGVVAVIMLVAVAIEALPPLGEPDAVFVATERDVRWGGPPSVDGTMFTVAMDCLNVDRWDGARWRQFIAYKRDVTYGWAPADEAAAARAAFADGHPGLQGCDLGASDGLGLEMPATAEPGINRWCGLDYQECYVFEYRWAGYQADYGGEAAVYRRIAGLTDCEALQAEFDAAADHHDRTGDRGSTGYMVAADDRLNEICDTPPPNGSLFSPNPGETMTSAAVAFEGAASDNFGVAEVNLVIKDLATSQFLQEDGTWGSWATVSTKIGNPGGSGTGWTWSGTIDRDGRFRVRVQVKDTSGNSDPTKATARFGIDTS